MNIQNTTDDILLNNLAQIIEQGKRQAVSQVNSMLTITYWHVGKAINEHILKNERAEYGEAVVSNISGKLQAKFGSSFALRGLRRMMQFANTFPDLSIVSPLVSQLSWTHIILIISVKKEDARLFYVQKCAEQRWSKRELSHQIERKAFERNEIATLQFGEELSA